MRSTGICVQAEAGIREDGLEGPGLGLLWSGACGSLGLMKEAGAERVMGRCWGGVKWHWLDRRGAEDWRSIEEWMGGGEVDAIANEC